VLVPSCGRPEEYHHDGLANSLLHCGISALSARAFTSARGQKCPKRLRLPAAKSTAEQMVKIVPAPDPGHPEEAVPCGASLILRGLRGFFVAGCDRLLTGEAFQTR
jgi:hypothetical protein